MVLGRKTNFFLVKTKKTIFFGVWPHSFPKMFFLVFLFFLGKSWFFLPKTIFFLGKSWFFCRKPSFSSGKPKNHLFGVWPHSVSKDGFFGFLVFPRKVGFGLGGYSAAVDFVLMSNLNELTDMSC